MKEPFWVDGLDVQQTISATEDNMKVLFGAYVKPHGIKSVIRYEVDWDGSVEKFFASDGINFKKVFTTMTREQLLCNPSIKFIGVSKDWVETYEVVPIHDML